jgi:hypothetical protein
LVERFWHQLQLAAGSRPPIVVAVMQRVKPAVELLLASSQLVAPVLGR